ncbi:MAG: hypothetical protein IKS18_06885 [Lachnospiraceae bacterium]|nr:hypothetical protein [Lachnospiraceae bacterium]
MNNKIMYVNDTKAMVTKAFAKKAVIFGTEEYKLWKAYREDFPNAKMITKNIKKNPDKRTNKNLTYENMAAYIKVSGNAEQLMELKRQIEMSKIQVNPYRAVLAWFLKTFEGYDSYKKYFEELAQMQASEKDDNSVAA